MYVPSVRIVSFFTNGLRFSFFLIKCKINKRMIEAKEIALNIYKPESYPTEVGLITCSEILDNLSATKPVKYLGEILYGFAKK